MNWNVSVGLKCVCLSRILSVRNLRAFNNFGIKENNLFRRHFMREFYCGVERVGEINKVVDFCFG